jgi:DNA-binding winged helix-turn-helix (wHTH) protein
MLYGFGAYTLDTDRRELKAGGCLVSLEPQVFDLIVYLIENRERVVCQDDLLDAVWGGRIVSKSTLTTRINAARKAIGDNGAQQSLIRTVVRKGFRFVAPVAELGGRHKDPKVPLTQPAAPLPRQRIQFARSADGVRIAWASVGSGPALVKPPNFLNHIEHDWEFRSRARFCGRLPSTTAWSAMMLAAAAFPTARRAASRSTASWTTSGRLSTRLESGDARCSASPTGARSPSPMPRVIPAGSRIWCCAEASRAGRGGWARRS